MQTNDPRRTGRGTRASLAFRRLLPWPCLFDGQLVGYVVFVNVSDVVDGFLPDVLGGNQFNVIEPASGLSPLSAACLRRRATRVGPAL
jgi:hypothetical protein